MSTDVKSRAWVKDAAIVLLVVLLLLTFFSNTIMNHSLPEVSTRMVGEGTITAKIRGSGVVEANGNHAVKAPATWTIGKVMVKVGQEVNAGDVLFVLGAGDSEELEQARITLEELEASYNQAALSVPLIKSFVGEQAEIQRLTRERDEALRARNEFEAQNNASIQGVERYLAEKDKCLVELNAAQARLDELEQQTETARINWKTAEAEWTNLSNRLASADPSADPEAYAALQTQVDAARQNADTAQTNYNSINATNSPLIAVVNNTVAEQTTRLDSINKFLDVSSGLSADYLKYQKAYEAAEAALLTAQVNLQYQIMSADRSVQAAYAGLVSISNQIQRQKDKIKELAGEGEENVITANVSGTITEVNCTSGDSVLKGDVLCAIEVPDMGYTVSFSVTNEQARRLRVGDSATISNYYWGNQVVATLSLIKSDPKSPMTQKLLTFDLEGDVSSGAEISVSVGQKSATYDIVIPNSSIRTDSNGSYVLAIEARNSPLGNRYMASRVAIEVLAADDVNSAVNAALNNGDYVITTSSAPVANGDQVRMADVQD